MSKRRTNASNGPKPAPPEPPQQSEEQALAASAESFPTHQTEPEQLNEREVQDSSTREEHGASEALMESYNG